MWEISGLEGQLEGLCTVRALRRVGAGVGLVHRGWAVFWHVSSRVAHRLFAAAYKHTEFRVEVLVSLCGGLRWCVFWWLCCGFVVSVVSSWS